MVGEPHDVRGEGAGPGLGLPISGVAGAVYAFIHVVVAIYCYTSLTQPELFRFWSVPAVLGLSLRQLSVGVAWALVGYACVDLLREARAPRRGRWLRLAVAAAAIALQLLVLRYLPVVAAAARPAA